MSPSPQRKKNNRHFPVKRFLTTLLVVASLAAQAAGSSVVYKATTTASGNGGTLTADNLTLLPIGDIGIDPIRPVDPWFPIIDPGFQPIDIGDISVLIYYGVPLTPHAQSPTARAAAQGLDAAFAYTPVGSTLDTLIHDLGLLADSSPAAADAALRSVSGAGTTIASLAAMDRARHHAADLRRHMGLPACPTESADRRTLRTAQGAVWVAATGSYDRQDGGSRMGRYTRCATGAMLGAEHRFSCTQLGGIALSCDDSLSRTDATRVRGHATVADVYGAVQQGPYRHRASLGFGLTDDDCRRGAYSLGTTTSHMMARSYTLSYELSRCYALDETRSVRPFATLDYARHSFGTAREQGFGDAALSIEPADIDQLTVGVGADYAKRFALLAGQEAATATFSAALNAELGERQPSATARFRSYNNVSYELMTNKRSPLFGRVGAALTVPFAPAWSATLGSGAELSNDRIFVSGSLGLKYGF